MYFEYWLEYYNEVDDVVDHASGVVYAETYSEAVNNITEYYGDAYIEKLEIRAAEDDPVYECELKKEKIDD